MLKDIIDSDCFNVVRLNEIFRQARDSDIVMNAHKINAGQEIDLDNKSRDFFMLKRNDPKVIINVILQLIIKNHSAIRWGGNGRHTGFMSDEKR